MIKTHPDATETDLYRGLARAMAVTATVVAVVLAVVAVSAASAEIALWALGSAVVAVVGFAHDRGFLRSPLAISYAFVGTVGVVLPLADSATATSLTNAVAVTALAACFLSRGRTPRKFLGFATIVWLSNLGWGLARHRMQLSTTHLMAIAIELGILIIAVMISLKATRGLALSRSKYRRVFELAPVALWENDFSAVCTWMDGLKMAGVVSLSDHLRKVPEDLTQAIASIRITNANPQALRSLGLRSLADLDDRYSAVLSPEAEAAFRVQFEAMWRGDPAGDELIKGSTLQGRPFDAIMRWSMVDDRGRCDPARTIVAISDITDMLRADNERMAANERYRSFADSSPNAMIATDATGRIIAWNPAATSMFGYEASEALHMLEEEIIPHRFRGLHRSSQSRVESPDPARAVNQTRLTGLRKDGSEFPLELSVGTWSVDERRFHSAILSDMTAEAVLEREASQRTEQLERLVRSKDQLIAAVSHQLRTPLTAVVGNSEVLRDSRSMLSETEVVEMTSEIASGALDLSDIVEDLLINTRCEADAIGLAHEPVDLAAEATRVVDRLWIVRHGCMRPIISGAAFASADAVRTRQIVRNLISNAMLYGGGLIHVEIGSTGAAVRLAVHDCGHGVSRDVVTGLFEPFMPADSAMRPQASIGLGLSISRRLARLMGGDLTYRYEDREAIFELTLPAAAHDTRPLTVAGSRAA